MNRALLIGSLLLATPALAQDAPDPESAQSAEDGPDLEEPVDRAPPRDEAQRQRRCRKGKARLQELDAEYAQLDSELADLTEALHSAKRRDRDEALEALVEALVAQRSRVTEITMERTYLMLEAQELGCDDGKRRRGPKRQGPPGGGPEGAPPDDAE